MPDLSVLYPKGKLSMNNILPLRDDHDGRKVREWFESEEYNSNRIYQKLLKSRPSLSTYSWQSLLRWFIPTVVGIINTPIGVAVSAVDNFIVSRLMGNWHPNLFFDDRLSKKLDEIIANYKKNAEHRRQLEIWGRNIGPNNSCPCHSG